MASIVPKTQREQMLAFVGILGLLGGFAYWNWVYSPGAAEVAVKAAHVDTLEKENQQSKAALAKGTVDQLRAEAKMYADNLELMRRLVPASNEVPALLDQVSNAARRVGLDIGSAEPLGMEEGYDFSTFKYKLTVGGTYHGIAEFLTNTASLPRIIAPTNISLRATPGGGGGRYPVQTDFEIDAYVARTSPRPAPAKPADKPGDKAPAKAGG